MLRHIRILFSSDCMRITLAHVRARRCIHIVKPMLTCAHSVLAKEKQLFQQFFVWCRDISAVVWLQEENTWGMRYGNIASLQAALQLAHGHALCVCTCVSIPLSVYASTATLCVHVYACARTHTHVYTCISCGHHIPYSRKFSWGKMFAGNILANGSLSAKISLYIVHMSHVLQPMKPQPTLCVPRSSLLFVTGVEML